MNTLETTDTAGQATRTWLHRFVRRCADYNALHTTDYTPETYDEARTREPRLIAWDEGWEACEMKLRAISAQFRKEADNLATYEMPRAKGAAIAYRDMADKLDAMFPAPNNALSKTHEN
jgi:hypothetical protein